MSRHDWVVRGFAGAVLTLAASAAWEPASAQNKRLECYIKGYVAPDGKRSYYMPGHPEYSFINVRRADLWFCRERDAKMWVQKQPPTLTHVSKVGSTGKGDGGGGRNK